MPIKILNVQQIPTTKNESEKLLLIVDKGNLKYPLREDTMLFTANEFRKEAIKYYIQLQCDKFTDGKPPWPEYDSIVKKAIDLFSAKEVLEAFKD